MRTILLALACLASLASSSENGGNGDKQPGEPCTEDEECVPGSICFNEFCVGDGVLRVSLGFDVDSDFDLHLLTPNAVEIYFGNPIADGGELDVDQCISGCGVGSHVENIVFGETAPIGQYMVWVENFDGRGTGPFSILVESDNAVTFDGSLPQTAGAASEAFLFDF